MPTARELTPRNRVTAACPWSDAPPPRRHGRTGRSRRREGCAGKERTPAESSICAAAPLVLGPCPHGSRQRTEGEELREGRIFLFKSPPLALLLCSQSIQFFLAPCNSSEICVLRIQSNPYPRLELMCRGCLYVCPLSAIGRVSLSPRLPLSIC